MRRRQRSDAAPRRIGAGLAVACAALALGVALPSAAEERNGADLFRRIAPVLQSPRCMNCHTREDFPRQGDDRHRHTFHVTRGPANHGAAGLHCATCHQAGNQAASGVPGASGWQLAPLRMAWEGLNVAALCWALRDPKKGGMTPDRLVPHFGTSLVRWAWEPGRDRTGRERTKPPIPYDRFMALTRAWVSKGATCPSAD